MKLLVLGGTRFLGHHVVDAAVARGHVVTVFNRGRALGALPREVHAITGDRTVSLDSLGRRRWDAVVDTSGYHPAVVRESATYLADSVEQYVFVSSLSVYADFSSPGIDEHARVNQLVDPLAPLSSETYGAFKAMCEREVERVLPGRTLTIRAGLLVGPRDDVGRFTYWVRRVAEGGEVLAPGYPERPIQIVDARDVAAWIVQMAEVRHAGIFNVTGPRNALTFGSLLDTCAAATGSNARITWAPERFLLDEGVRPWVDMPLWPPEIPELRHFFEVDTTRAHRAGLRHRPLEQTVADTLEWAEAKVETPIPERDYGVTVETPGITRERERELLDRLRSRE